MRNGRNKPDIPPEKQCSILQGMFSKRIADDRFKELIGLEPYEMSVEDYM